MKFSGPPKGSRSQSRASNEEQQDSTSLVGKTINGKKIVLALEMKNRNIAAKPRN